MKTMFLLLTLGLLLAACAAPAPTPTGTPTSAPSTTPTLEPTLTSTPVPDTPTLPPPSLTPSSAGSATGELACKLLMQSVPNGSHFKPKERFDVGWKVRNTGTVRWDPDSIDFTYFRGTNMNQSILVHLTGEVEPGNTVMLYTDLIAPGSPGGYTTIWTLMRGEQDFCHLSVTIHVP